MVQKLDYRGTEKLHGRTSRFLEAVLYVQAGCQLCSPAVLLSFRCLLALKKAGVLVQSNINLKVYVWIETAIEQQRLTGLLLNFSTC
jgi:hypothetical protein